MLAKIILVVTMAASALLGGGGGTLDREEAAAFDGYYLHVDELGQPSLWQETNGAPGLQTSRTLHQGGAFRLETPPDNRVLL